jgi:hypothetical protein
MRRLVLLALLLGWAVCAYAGPVEFRFVAFNDGAWQNGYPYIIQPTEGSSGSILFAMCDDYLHGGSPGQVWDANITQLGSDNISLARFNKIVSGPTSLSPLTLYEEAGWILLQTQVTQSTEFQSMNYAVWHIFDPNAPLVGDAQFWLDEAMAQAQMHFPGSDFNKVYIITPVNQYDPDPHGPQEFLALGTDSGLNINPPPGSATVPEPGTLVLLGGGVLALAGRKFLG